MRKHNSTPEKDIDICKTKVIAILKEYNCEIEDREGYSGCIIVDKDTKESLSFT